MDTPDLPPPHGPSPNPVEIRDDDAITIDDALLIASPYPLGKSTLQKWAKFWRENPGGAVKSVLVDTSAGRIYKLSREDFKAWVFDQQQNNKSREAPQGLIRPSKTSQDLERPDEVSREAVEDAKRKEQEKEKRIKELENENLQLKIDLGVRKQLLERVKEEFDDIRSAANNLLRENGALQYQIRQLAPPEPKREVNPEQSFVDSPPTPDQPHSLT